MITATSSQHGPAPSLKEFAQSFLSIAEAERDFDGAAQAILQAILNGEIGPDWQETERHIFYRAAILADDARNRPSRLVVRAAEMHTANVPRVLLRVATALEGFLKEVWREQPLSKNALLLLLQLRHGAGPWLDQDELSRQHVRALPQFTLSDMELPYNVMFDPISHARNVEDIRKLDAARLERFPLFQLLLFRWIAGREFALSGKPDAPEGSGDAGDLNRAAARSLAKRERSRRASPSGVRVRLMRARPYQVLQAGLGVLSQRISAPALRHGRPRVAVCISGQLRGFRTAFPTLRAILLAGVEHEIFVDTWRDVGRSGAEPFRKVLPFASASFADAYRQYGTLLGMEEMKLRYPSLFMALGRTAQTDAAELAGFFETDNIRIEDDKSESFSAFSNSAKMHYKISACSQQVFASGDTFDLILRIRPDKPVTMTGFSWRDVNAVCQRFPLLYADQGFGYHYARLLMGDQFAVGAPENMRIYANAYETYPRYAEDGLFQCVPGFHGHATLAQVCWLGGLTVERLPIRFGPLAELAPLSTDEILSALEQDAASRLDSTDIALIDAARQDR